MLKNAMTKFYINERTFIAIVINIHRNLKKAKPFVKRRKYLKKLETIKAKLIKLDAALEKIIRGGSR